jgi:microcystin degradation protein MlrC
MCHLWLDSPDLSWSVVVTTNGDRATAERLADQLADQAWQVRNVAGPHFPGPEEAMQIVRKARLRRRTGTVCMCDASDVVGAGAPGTNTHLLKVLLDQGQGLRIYATIRDGRAVEALQQTSVGAPVALSLGGHEPGSSPALPVSGTLARREDDPVYGALVVLDLDHVQLVVTTGPPLVMKPSYYRNRGLRPSRADIVMVKNLFPFRWFFGLHNRLTLYVTTEGATDMHIAHRLEFDHPTHPKDVVEDWRPADRARRLEHDF